MTRSSPYLIVIAGPTAVGKTDVAIQIARHYQTSVISADSRQCYREMNIGTATPGIEELQKAPHYFINSHSIGQNLNAADYERLALGYCSEVFTEKNVAVVCGGTGLYIKALCEGIDEMPQTDELLEKELHHQWVTHGLKWLQEKCQAEDPLFFAQGEQQNPMRLIRALAFKRSTGKSILDFRKFTPKERPFRIIKIGLDLPRQELYERINQRVDIMMEEGLLEEARSLLPYQQLKNLQTVGYRELFDYLNGRVTLDQAVQLIKQNSRRYAKRQLTWFRKDPQFHWFLPTNVPALLQFIEQSIRSSKAFVTPPGG